MQGEVNTGRIIKRKIKIIQIISTGGANQDGGKKNEASGENIPSWQRDRFPT